MKYKNFSKKITAVLMAVILICTSLPMMVMGAAAVYYDPAPYFSESAINTGVKAWVDEEGNVQVTFPSATAQPTYKGEPLEIAFYILELSDMGRINTKHSNTVIDTIKVDANGTNENKATFPAAAIGELDTENRRYNVSVTAVDEEKWFSQSIHTTLTAVPDALIDPSKFANFSTSATAVREIVNFESDSDSADDYTLQTGDKLIYSGAATGSGTPDISDNVGDTTALRFIMYEKPTSTQTFDTSWSRQTWDFDGAEEVWFWFDLEGVELTGLSFRLRAHEYVYEDWNNDSKFPLKNRRVSDIVYSTKGTAAATYTGEDPYVYVQRGDGGWDKVMLKDDGTVDVGNMVGYIRVPLKFMCSETDTYVDLSNQDLGQGHNFKNGLFDAYSIKTDEILAYLPTLMFAPVLVDPAGTSVTNALHLHRRIYRSYSGIANAGTEHMFVFNNANGIQHIKSDEVDDINVIDFSKVGYMLAANLDTPQTSVAVGGVSTDRAYVANGTIQNREAGLKPIQDICTAGFSIEGCSDDSLSEDFFLDNIFFYRSDGGQYSENTLGDNPANTGDSLNKYFNEELEISRIIFDEIDKYIETPDWTDYREVNYITQLVAEYTLIYQSMGKPVDFLETDAMDTDADGKGLCVTAKALGRDSWQKYLDAYNACVTEGTIGHSNADKNDLLPSIVNTLEKMPKAENVTAVSDVLRREIIKIWRAYTLLNLGQLDMLGNTEENEIVALIALVANADENGDVFVVGDKLANNPYIVFNNFENNTLGDKAYKLENDRNAYTTAVKGGTGDLANDWRHLKNFTSYSTNGATNIADAEYYGYVTTDGDKTQEAMDGKVVYDAAYSEITDGGYLNSNAATVNVESDYTSADQTGTFHTITVTKDGKDFSNYTDMEANNMSVNNLGSLVTPSNLQDSNDTASLVFYVDFTQITGDFYFTANIYTKDASGTYWKFRPRMGVNNPLTESAEEYEKKNWTYYILDPATGEWVENHTTSQWCYTSIPKTAYGDRFTLSGYRGYIKIPLKHFKYQKSLIDNPRLDLDAAMMNNIYAIQFCVGGAAADTLYGKSFTIDNIGFTYDSSLFASQGHTTYAEAFNAKSTSAKKYEAYVNGDTITEIETQMQDSTDADGNPIQVPVEVEVQYPGVDIYDAATRSERLAKAVDMYNALPQYQKNIVIDAYNTMTKYNIMIRDNNVPTPEYSPAELNELLNALPNEVKTASVTGEQDLVYPGFVSNEVNYGAYGLDADLASQIIDYYEKSYCYYSEAQKKETNSVTLLIAYRAAMRTASSLSIIKNELDVFTPQMASVYHAKNDLDGNPAGSFTSIARRSEVQLLWDNQYKPLQYYSKISLESDDVDIYSQFANASRGLTYFLKNTQRYTIDGEVVEGGIITYLDKLESIYTMAKGHIDNKELFTDEELQLIKDTIEEYNALLPAYHNVEELFDMVQQIIALFPTADVSLDTTAIVLDRNNLTNGSATYSVNYSEILDLNNKGDKYVVRITSTNGAMTNGAGDSVAYSVSADGGTAVKMTATAKIEIDVENNTYTPGAPKDIAITPSLSSIPTMLRGDVQDTLKIELVLMETVTVDVDGVPTDSLVETVVDTKTLVVAYSLGDLAYEVQIPAQVAVPFGSTTAATVDVNVAHNLSTTETLKISMADGEENGTMVINTANIPTGVTIPDPLPQINYTASFTDKTITGLGNGVNTSESIPLSVTVSEEQWNQAYVEEYIDQDGVTFKVEYSNS